MTLFFYVKPKEKQRGFAPAAGMFDDVSRRTGGIPPLEAAGSKQTDNAGTLSSSQTPEGAVSPFWLRALTLKNLFE